MPLRCVYPSQRVRQLLWFLSQASLTQAAAEATLCEVHLRGRDGDILVRATGHLDHFLSSSALPTDVKK